jgi:hypothetical protein
MTEEKNKTAPLSLITVWGQSGVGKTFFGITSPYRPVLVLDTERSSQTYYIQGLIRFERVDCLTWLGPNGLKKTLEAIEPGKWGTVVIDTGSQFCEWVAREIFVQAGPRSEKQASLVWGEVKQAVRQYLLDLMRKVHVVVVTASDRSSFSGGRPTGQREPKILDVVRDLSDIFIELRRDPNQQVPYGLCMPPWGKSRIQALPPKLSPATWGKLLHYLQEKPANWGELGPDEQIPDSILFPMQPPSIVVDMEE